MQEVRSASIRSDAFQFGCGAILCRRQKSRLEFGLAMSCGSCFVVSSCRIG